MIAVAGILACAAVAGFVFIQPGTVRVDAADVSIVPISKTVFAPSVRVSGIATPARSASVAAGEGGTVAQILRRNGDVVRAGEIILRLENPGLQREVSAARLALNAQVGELLTVEAQTTRQLRDAEQGVRTARYQAERARRDLDRQEQLSVAGFASSSALERAQAEQAFASAELQSALAGLREAEGEARSRLVRVREARNALHRLDALQAHRLAALDITATTNGTLAGLEVSVGRPITADEIIGRIEDEATLEVLLTVPESRQRDIRIGGQGSFDLDGTEGTVRVRAIEPAVVNGEFKVRAEFVGAPPPGLRGGRSIFVNLALGAPREAIVAPVTAVIGGDTLLVLDGGRSARARHVQLGERSGAVVEILSGARAGDRIIQSSVRPLDDVNRVQIEGE